MTYHMMPPVQPASSSGILTSLLAAGTVATAMIIALASTQARAQDGLVATPAAARTVFSADLAQLVDKTFPSYQDAALATRLTNASRTLSARQDQVSTRTLVGIEQLLGLPASSSTGLTEVDTTKAYYRVAPLDGKSFAHLKDETFVGLPRATFQGIATKVQQNQRAFLTRLGLPADELMKISFHKVMAQSLKEGSTNNSDGTPAVVRRGMTLGYRSFAGFPIEGSDARVSSYGAEKVQAFALSWPKFQLHPGASQIALDPPATVKQAILQKLKAAVPAGGEVALFMGVVFRQAKTTTGQLVHLPAMKVAVTPKAHLLPGARGDTQTDGGVVFYAKLLRNEPADATADGQD